ncbi:TPA: NAD(P)-dependent oxidoreductase [Pseudomonas putida]|uniref:NAD-dependent epimerase/dehydratase family protein n=1 Tax=Pseudomonas putida TaxID=303 RepID=UPI00110C8F2E|nr:NAD(P)-dependent oxidoreductase [Pseudomonas putida]MDD1993790.1 NAD(P)-dependent oxidoreductase [Pseudomonas putida]HDS0916915.1 NAD(P)-dependent oxidoreductase [Pseudomonas putida]HDS0932556.1 NAD(P)-dependent oxidoreductase [Pseudomonas putida]HDS1782124.1 NAD(P)-dependent oxidoreductase [Pseudomonas putida]HDS3797934.1 NAD(P)-dependent oxidoreductase [Pseudomonas putida]
MKILVLGANGFIGKRLVRILTEEAHSIRILTRKPGNVSSGNLEVLVGDLTSDALDFDSLVDGCEVIINCAGEIRNEQLMPALHVGAVKRLLDAVGRRGGGASHVRWVQLSSVGAYGPAGGRRRVVTEQTPPNPQGVYETTKTDADKLIMSHAALQGDSADWVILRPSNVFASDMPNGSIRQLAKIIGKRMFFYVGREEAIATYIHANDVAAALVCCSSGPRAARQIYNLSNDCRLRDVVEALAGCQRVPPPQLRVPERLVRVAVWLAGNLMRLPLTQGRVDALVNKTAYPAEKIRNDLNFVPKCNVPLSIVEVIQQ